MSTTNKVDFATVVGVCVTATLALIGGCQTGEIRAHNDAILHNAAHYEADANGAPVFKWGARP